ncbi:MAG: PhnD/SsuA/transferrin family substrate-binding protein, partial [Pseudomonadota bacterium]|nr:PhnD/SsuA/transferrin family substrate-binding protein [Pseudomonadota bacterium]
AVSQGKVDAAFIATHRLDNAISKGDVKKEDFHIIWSSKPVPQDPFVYRGALCPELKAKIKDTFLGLSKDDPGEKKFLDNVKSNKFVPMASEDYDLIRDLQAAKEANKKKS